MLKFMLDTNMCIFTIKNRREFDRVPGLRVEDWINSGR
jgi:predicted nucleic acid-binding protein